MKKITQNLKWLVSLLTMIVSMGAWAEETGTITFGNNGTKINSASVTGSDTQKNTWTITTVGTTSFTAQTEYYQVGSSSKPATSITFTTTLAEDVTITAFSAKFGGFNGTAGTVSLKVGDETVGTGNLNGSNDVTVSSTTSETGKVLTVTVTGISKGVKCYYISYTYTSASGKQNSQIAWSASEASATMGINFNNAPTLSNPYYLPVTYNSSAPTVATIGNNGAITLVGAGTTTISAVFVGDDTYDAKTVSYTLTVSKQDVTLSFSETSFNVDFDDKDSFEEPTLTGVPEGLTVTYSSNKTDVATVDATTGDVTIVGKGSVQITATFAATPIYNGASKTYTINVTGTYKKANGYYALVTDASTLVEGDEIIIVNTDANVALSTNQKTNNRDEISLANATWNAENTLVEITINETGDNVQALTLEASSDKWLFNTGNGYLYAASSSSNYLKTESTADNNAKATISISNGNATITFKGSNTRNTIFYNSSSNLFSCYASSTTSQAPVQIYRKVVVVEGTLAAGKFATRIYPFAPKPIEGIVFYSCEGMQEGKATTLALKEVETPEANTPYILENTTEAAIDITQSGVDIHEWDTYTAGLLTGVLRAEPITILGDEYYVLQTQNGKQAFYVANNYSIDVPQYRAYLTYNADGAGQVKALSLGGDDATAINTLEALTSGAYEAIYTVDGVKLSRVEKGVNILKMADGTTRKVIVK